MSFKRVLLFHSGALWEMQTRVCWFLLLMAFPCFFCVDANATCSFAHWCLLRARVSLTYCHGMFVWVAVWLAAVWVGLEGCWRAKWETKKKSGGANLCMSWETKNKKEEALHFGGLGTIETAFSTSSIHPWDVLSREKTKRGRESTKGSGERRFSSFLTSPLFPPFLHTLTANHTHHNGH